MELVCVYLNPQNVVREVHIFDTVKSIYEKARKFLAKESDNLNAIFIINGIMTSVVNDDEIYIFDDEDDEDEDGVTNITPGLPISEDIDMNNELQWNPFNNDYTYELHVMEQLDSFILYANSMDNIISKIEKGIEKIPVCAFPGDDGCFSAYCYIRKTV